MKQLFLLRHAKSSWDDPSLDDFERPLNKRGRRSAKAIADHLGNHALRPAAILCSPAKRARQTLELIQPALGKEIPVTFDMRLYEASRQTLLARLTELMPSLPSVLLVGHNPGLQRLALYLAREQEANPQIHLLHEKYPTGGLVTFSAAIETWKDLRAGICGLEGFVRPSELAE